MPIDVRVGYSTPHIIRVFRLPAKKTNKQKLGALSLSSLRKQKKIIIMHELIVVILLKANDQVK